MQYTVAQRSCASIPFAISEHVARGSAGELRVVISLFWIEGWSWILVVLVSIGDEAGLRRTAVVMESYVLVVIAWRQLLSQVCQRTDSKVRSCWKTVLIMTAVPA